MTCGRIKTDKDCNLIIDDQFDNRYVNIYVIKHIAVDGTVTSMIALKEKESDLIICKFKLDGHYNICKIDVPLNPKNSLYYYKDGKFYKDLTEVELKEVILVNPEVSNLKFEYEDYFCTCHLWACYVKVCLEIFDKRASIKCNSGNIDSSLIYKRDLINSVLNVVKYMADLDQFAEASRLLERIIGCNGLCDNTLNLNGCGCM